MGTSFVPRILVFVKKDHPHAYGDKMKKKTSQRKSRGSSPRVWGQGTYFILLNTHLGIIPTRMGTSNLGYFAALLVWDHPHAYGDKTSMQKVWVSTLGSSPRVWGQGKSGNDRFSAGRIIPTRMGTRSDSGYGTNITEDHPHAYGDKWKLLLHV